MRRRVFLLAVLFISSATTMRVYAAPDCAEILKYRGGSDEASRDKAYNTRCKLS